MNSNLIKYLSLLSSFINTLFILSTSLLFSQAPYNLTITPEGDDFHFIWDWDGNSDDINGFVIWQNQEYCEEGFLRDCYDECYGINYLNMLNNGHCDYFLCDDCPRFSCEDFEESFGDCDDSSCGDGTVESCSGNGECVPEEWTDGPGTCYNNYSWDLSCYDIEMDCPEGCGYGYLADCDGSGACCPRVWLGDGTCNNGFWCDLTCYDNDDGGDCDDSSCGDGLCTGDETEESCPEDCGDNSCGNGICEDGESSFSCPDDCPSSEECEDCLYDYTPYGSECCDSAVNEFLIPCWDLEYYYGWDCTGCMCIGLQSGDNSDVKKLKVRDEVQGDSKQETGVIRQIFKSTHPISITPEKRTSSRSFTIIGASSDTQQMMSGNNGDCFYITTFNNNGSFSVPSNTACVNECCEPGDFNCDLGINVLDIIEMVNCILASALCLCGDLSSDGEVNILDLIFLVNLILGG